MLQARSTPRYKLRFLLALGFLVVAIIFIISRNQPRVHPDFVELPQPRLVQAFQLNTGKNGKAVFSKANFNQHWTILFFGFTHCSDICPATLAILDRAYQGLRSEYPNLQVVFVTLDYQHDSAKSTQAYAATFNKHFIGVSGKGTQVKILQNQFGVAAEDKHTPGKYEINHGSSIYIINPQGQWQALLPYGLTAQQIQNDLKILIEKPTHV